MDDEKIKELKKIAEGMSPALMPAFTLDKEVRDVCVKYGWDIPDTSNIISKIQFHVKFQALIRFQYAKYMLEESEKERNYEPNTKAKLTIIE